MILIFILMLEKDHNLGSKLVDNYLRLGKFCQQNSYLMVK